MHVLALFSELHCYQIVPRANVTEDERGDHLREFLQDPEQDLEGFDDMAHSATATQSGEEVSAPSAALQVSAPSAASDDDDESSQLSDANGNDADLVAEAILRDATDFGVDDWRDGMRPVRREAAVHPLAVESDGEAGDGVANEGVVGEREAGVRAADEGVAGDAAHSTDADRMEAEEHSMDEAAALEVGNVLKIQFSARDHWLGSVVSITRTPEKIVAVMNWFDGSAREEIILAGPFWLHVAVLGAVNPSPQYTIHLLRVFLVCVQVRIRSVGLSSIQSLSYPSSRIWVRQRPQSYLQVLPPAQ